MTYRNRTAMPYVMRWRPDRGVGKKVGAKEQKVELSLSYVWQEGRQFHDQKVT